MRQTASQETQHIEQAVPLLCVRYSFARTALAELVTCTVNARERAVGPYFVCKLV